MAAAASTLFFACNGASERTPDTSEVSDGQALTAASSGVEDSYVSTSFPDNLRGTYPNLRVGNSTRARQETFLKFTVSGLPADATNVRAHLKLHATTTTSDAVQARRATSAAWSESTLVLSNAPGAAAAVLDTSAGTTAGQWTTFDVSGAVTTNGQVAFVLSVSSGAIADFDSKEAGAATAPSLDVTYERPSTATSTLFGAGFSPHSDARFADLSGQWGGMKVVRSYDGGKGIEPFLASVQTSDIAHGAASVYSFKYQPAAVLAGTHDAQLRSFFQGIKDDHLVYWSYFHEPDDQLYKTHEFTPTAYRAAWAHIKTIANAVKATRPRLNIKATLIIMQYSMTPKVAPSRPLLGPDGMYPGDDVIDVFGVDGYNAPADQGQVVDAAEQFGKVIDFAEAHHKPWGIGELGSCPVKGNPQGRAQYLSGALSYFKSRTAPVFVAYFDLDWPACDYRFDNDAPATKVWHDAMTKGYAPF